MRITVKRGLDVPLAGSPRQQIDEAPAASAVGLLGRDYPGLKPRMRVAEGDRVRLGDPLFSDKRLPGVDFTSPGCGIVEAIHRGARRVLQSVVVRLDGDDEVTFDARRREDLSALDGDELRRILCRAGLWTALRTRPFSAVPDPASAPHSIFVTAIDTHPLAAPPEWIVATAGEDFEAGLAALTRLTAGKVYVCTAPGAEVPVPAHEQLERAEFAGPHPAGLAGTHIHFLDPVSAAKTVWYLGYQDVIAVGRLLTTGRIPTERIVALTGPMVERPRLLRTRLGAGIAELVEGELRPGNVRVVSGSVLGGHRAVGWARFLGRYHQQITVLAEGGRREFFGWLRPGRRRFSAVNAFTSALRETGPLRLNTSQHGSPRAMVPIGNFEKVLPLDMLPAPLLKALVVRDMETAVELGCLELDEEDVALLSFVDCGKYEYGPVLRENLDALLAEQRH